MLNRHTGATHHALNQDPAIRKALETKKIPAKPVLKGIDLKGHCPATANGNRSEESHA